MFLYVVSLTLLIMGVSVITGANRTAAKCDSARANL